MFSSGLHFTLILTLVCVCVSSFTVFTENGAISGTVFKTYKGRTVSAFLGVPYAKPPLGEYRFKEPQPVENWKGVRPAHNFSSSCIQYTYYGKNPDPIVGDEDCLYLNVYTPTTSNDAKLNVIFYMHGGAFMYGAGHEFTPDYILNYQDLVFVTINYRLGPFGFLTTEDGVIPGNIGLKDQVLALKWVQNNIEKFGGDRKKVTIAGLSAGGASVHLHYLSHSSRDLFNQGISLSGSALCPWVLTENSRRKAKILADSVGCPNSDSNLLLKCLQQKPAKSLLSRMEELFLPWNHNPFSPFGPVVENNDINAFLTKNPYELLSEGDIKDASWLTSMTNEEGLYQGAEFITHDELLQDLNENWNRIAPHLLDYNNTIPYEQLDEVSEKIRNYYIGNKSISKENVKELIKMMSDRLFVQEIERAARLQASMTTSPVYFYDFAYRGKHSLTEYLCKCNNNLGVSHGDDLIYLLKGGLSPLESKEDRDMLKTMVRIWTSFVQSGVPSASPEIEWMPVSPRAAEDEANLTYLLISSSNDIKLSSSPGLGNRKFWDGLPFSELWNFRNSRCFDEL